MNRTEALLTLSNASVSFGSRLVVDRVSLTIHQGDIVTVSYTPAVNKIKDAASARPAAALTSQAVSNNYGGAILHQVVQCGLYMKFALRVQCAGSLIEQ